MHDDPMVLTVMEKKVEVKAGCVVQELSSDPPDNLATMLTAWR